MTATVLLSRGDGSRATSAAPAARRIAVGGVHGVAAGDGSVWAAIYRGRIVVRVAPETGDVLARIFVGPRPTNPAVDRSSVWVPILGREELAEIDTATNQVVRRVPGAFSAVAAGFGSVWVTEWRGAPRQLERWYGRDVARIDPRTGRVLDVARPGGTLLDIGTGFGSVWAADFDRGLVWRIDPRSGRIIARIPVGPHPSHLAFGFGSVWVMSEHARVVRISPAHNRVEASVRAPLDGESDFVTTGAGAVWIAAYDAQLQGTLVEIDPTSNSVTRTVPVGQGPQGVAVEGDGVWVGHLEDGTLWRVSAHR